MRRGEAYDRHVLRADAANEVRRELTGLSRRGLHWVEFSEQASNLIRRVVPHERACWHPTDPGTLLVSAPYEGMTSPRSLDHRAERALPSIWLLLASVAVG
jgi:hypothetical protein